MHSDKIINAIKNYEFKDSLDLFMAMYALSEIKRQDDALLLYEKFTTEIKESGNEIIGLITIIGICQEKKDCIKLQYYLGKLVIIAPDHSLLVNLKKQRI